MATNRFEKVKIASRAAMDAPRIEIFRENGVYAYSTLIPETHNVARRVYFVSGTKGEEYGQFPCRNETISRAVAMARLTYQERAKFDN